MNNNYNRKRQRAKKFFSREIILEKLAEIGETVINNLIDTAIDFPTVFSRHKNIHNLSSFPRAYSCIDLTSKTRFWSLLYKLRQEGLIAKTGSAIKITEKGKDYLVNNPSWIKKYKNRKENSIGKLNLVIFDIPEKDRYKRDWLRHQLRELNFHMLQMSVWYSRCLLPEEFVNDLEKYKLLPYVHILSVNQRGTVSSWF